MQAFPQIITVGEFYFIGKDGELNQASQSRIQAPTHYSLVLNVQKREGLRTLVNHNKTLYLDRMYKLNLMWPPHMSNLGFV